MKRRALPVLLASFLSTAAAPPPRSIHEAELALHRNVEPAHTPSAGPRLFGAGAPGPRARRIVYGYYPYWVTQWENLRWDLLTHIAYFSVEIDATGTPTAMHGWPNTEFVAGAHAQGVKVDLTFTLFSGTGIHTLCTSPENRARAIDAMIDALEAGGADGINVDFEGVEAATRDAFTTFILELRAELTARGHLGAGIGIAGPAVDWTSAFDLGALAGAIDVYFIMGYGYHWGGSSKPGPVGQLRVDEAWRAHMSISMERTLAHYAGLVPAEGRAKIVLGVPYYGYDWPAGSAMMHAAATGNASSRTYAAARRAIASGRTRLWDEGSQNPWYTYSDASGWRQTWYDDEESLAAKYQLALEQEIGGIGVWALGYDEDYPELWDTLDAYFTAEPTVVPGMRADPIAITEFPYRDENDTSLAPSNYFDAYSCAPELPEYGREWVYSFALCRSGRIDASVTDGAGVDIDLHLLREPIEAECIARSDAAISESLMPGTYYLVLDTYVSREVAQSGAYRLDVTFAPDNPNDDCGEPKAGPVEVEPEIDLPAEPEGEIVHPVEPMKPEMPEIEGEIVPAEGCACSAARESRGGGLWIALAMIISARRRRGSGLR